MGKQPNRWPIWKIAVATAGCALAAAGLYGLSILVERAGVGETKNAAGQTVVLTLPSLIVMLASTMALLSVLGVVWLAFRIRDARIPPWEKRGKKRWR